MEQEPPVRDAANNAKAQNGWTDLEDEAPLFPTRTRGPDRVAQTETEEGGDWEVESDIPALPDDPPAALMAFDDSSDDDIQDYRVVHRVTPPPKHSNPTSKGKSNNGVPANFFEDGSSSDGEGGEERIGNIGEEEVEEAAKMVEEQRLTRFDGRQAAQRPPPTEPPSRKRQALNLALLSDANSDTPMSELLATKPIPHHVRPHTAAPKIMKRPGTAGEKYPYPNSVYSSPTEQQASPNQSRLRLTGGGAVRPMTAAQRSRLPPALAEDTRRDLHSTMYTEQERNRRQVGPVMDEGTAGSPLRTVKALQQQKPRPSYTRGNRRKLDATGLPEPDTDSDTESPSAPVPGGINGNGQSEVQRGGAGRRGSGTHHTPAGLVASLRGDSRERMYEPDEALASPTAIVDPRRRPGTSHNRSSSILLGGKRARPSSTAMAHPSTPWAVP